jgi:hypothetical protein
LDELRAELLQLQPSGPDGFEGLVATALAELTGLTFRLAKSGSQFGRDASTPRARFAIAMEAKRYGDSLRLEDVAGKIWIASNELAPDIDLWALCATSEMGDSVLAKLEQMLEERGISLLMLDWTAAPIPRLAVLLAAARTKIAQWCAARIPALAAAKVNVALAAIEADAAFASARDQLKGDASAAHAGLTALAEVNKRWCDTVFVDRAASRRAFGQYLTVSDPSRPAIPRPSLDAALEAALSTTQQSPGCVAVVGPEGSGKSWLAARWWSAAVDKPILLVGGSQLANEIEQMEPLKTLARLIAAQGDGDLDAQAKRWLRRLLRWRERQAAPSSSAPRFLVVLDGLNEQSGLPWAETIVRLSVEVRKLDGRLLITCRERFWEREIVPRLAGVDVIRVPVGDYTPEELEAVLRQRNVSMQTLSEQVRAFLRNPRICSVALDLLDRLAVQADELTIERLLLEYWRRRLEERGDLIAHNVRDFEKLLRSHANALKTDPSIQFDRDEWRMHSGAAQRKDGRSVENDLTEIEEGAFLHVVKDRDGFYEFKPSTVPFALGLLAARELQDELRKPNRDPAEVIDGIVEEVQGFDLVAEALRAAAGIACFDANFPPSGRAALISAWLELQNVPESGYVSLIAYAAACPEAALDATEAAFDERANSRRRRWLIATLLDTRDRPRVACALEPRIAKWLGQWSRKPRRLGLGDEREEACLRRRISDRLGSLTSAEQAFLAQACNEVASPEAMQLDAVAALLIAGRPQEAYAEGVLAWALAWTLTGDLHRADADLSWTIRLNREDFPEFEANLRRAIDALLNEPHSDTSRSAAAIALRVLGTVASAEEADRLSPRKPGQSWRRVEGYCQTDPFDPASVSPVNLVNALREAETITPAQVWLHISPAEKDLELEWITPGLARFEPVPIVGLLREVAKTAQTRSQLALRQLSWQLRRLSPLFDEATLLSVLAAYKRLVRQPTLIAAADQRHVPGSLLSSLLPHFDAARQLELYIELPNEVADWYAFRETFAPLGAAELEAALVDAEGDPIKLRRTLFFASAHRCKPSEKACEVIGRALNHDDPRIVSCASDLAYRAGDAKLDELVIAAACRRGGGADAGDDAFWRARAVASAVVRLGRIEDAALVAPRFFGSVAEQLGGQLDQRVVNDISLAIQRLLSPIQAAEPQLGRLFIDAGRSDRDLSRRVEDRAGGEDSVERLKALTKASSGPRRGIDEFAERQKALREEAESYLEQLSTENARVLAQVPDISALKRVATWDLSTATEWACRILAVSDEACLSTIRNLALGLAEAMAESDPSTAAALWRHVAKSRSPVAIVRGDARIPQEAGALFAGPDAEPLEIIRRAALDGAMSDAELEALVFAAEAAGHSDWLQRWIGGEAESGMPGRIARALTVEGLRDRSVGVSPILARDWGTGFLGQVAERARHAFDRNAWARTWAVQAVCASDPVDFWRWGELMSGIVDIRAFHWFDLNLDAPMIRRFGGELSERLRKAAESRTKKRKDTLFGLKRPDGVLPQLLLTSIRDVGLPESGAS